MYSGFILFSVLNILSGQGFLVVLLSLLIYQIYLTILTGKACALLNSVQRFIEIQGWLLLTFSICPHNQLSSFNSIIVGMSEKGDSSNRQ